MPVTSPRFSPASLNEPDARVRFALSALGQRIYRDKQLSIDTCYLLSWSSPSHRSSTTGTAEDIYEYVESHGSVDPAEMRVVAHGAATVRPPRSDPQT